MNLTQVTREDLEKIGISLSPKIKLPSEVEGEELKNSTLAELRKQFSFMESDFTQILTNYQRQLTELQDGLLNHVSRRLDKDGLEEAIANVTQDIERLEKTKSSLQAIITGQSAESVVERAPKQAEQSVENKPKANAPIEESPAPKTAERPQPIEQPREQKRAAAPSASSTPMLDQALAILDGAGDITDKPQALQFVRDLWKETQGKRGPELARYTEVMAQLGESASAPTIAAAVAANKTSIFTDRNQDGRISVDEAKSRLRYSGGVDTLKEMVGSGFYTVDEGVQGVINRESRLQEVDKNATARAEAGASKALEEKAASWERGFREDWSKARQGDQAAMDRLNARDTDRNGVLNAQDIPGAREPLKDYLNQHPVKLDDIAPQGGLVSKQDIKEAGKALRNMDVGMYVPTPYGTYEVHGRNNGAVRIAEIDTALQRGTDVKGILDLNRDGVVTKGELKQVLDASGLKQNINELAQHMGMAGITIQEGNSSPVHNNASPNDKPRGR